MATLGGSAPTLSYEARTMGPKRILALRRAWWKFGWKLEDFFRRFLGLKDVNKDTRYFWLLEKRVEADMRRLSERLKADPHMRELIAARERFAERIFRDLYAPTAGQDQP